jgi:hypothetical protein
MRITHKKKHKHPKVTPRGTGHSLQSGKSARSKTADAPETPRGKTKTVKSFDRDEKKKEERKTGGGTEKAKSRAAGPRRTGRAPLRQPALRRTFAISPGSFFGIGAFASIWSKVERVSSSGDSPPHPATPRASSFTV